MLVPHLVTLSRRQEPCCTFGSSRLGFFKLNGMPNGWSKCYIPLSICLHYHSVLHSRQKLPVLFDFHEEEIETGDQNEILGDKAFLFAHNQIIVQVFHHLSPEHSYCSHLQPLPL